MRCEMGWTKSTERGSVHDRASSASPALTGFADERTTAKASLDVSVDVSLRRLRPCRDTVRQMGPMGPMGPMEPMEPMEDSLVP
jgi:hypothetical protein